MPPVETPTAPNSPWYSERQQAFISLSHRALTSNFWWSFWWFRDSWCSCGALLLSSSGWTLSTQWRGKTSFFSWKDHKDEVNHCSLVTFLQSTKKNCPCVTHMYLETISELLIQILYLNTISETLKYLLYFKVILETWTVSSHQLTASRCKRCLMRCSFKTAWIFHRTVSMA